MSFVCVRWYSPVNAGAFLFRKHQRKISSLRVPVKAYYTRFVVWNLLFGESKIMGKQIRPFVRFRGAVNSIKAVHLKICTNSE